MRLVCRRLSFHLLDAPPSRVYIVHAYRPGRNTNKKRRNVTNKCKKKRQNAERRTRQGHYPFDRTGNIYARFTRPEPASRFTTVHAQNPRRRRPVCHFHTITLLTVDPAEIAVPPDRHNIRKQDAMLKR